MTMRFNSPPGWPVPPAGWIPPAGWVPPETWPPAPAGWQFWMPAEQSPAAFVPVVPAPNRPAPEVPPRDSAAAPPMATGLPPAPAPAADRSSGGMFGGRRRQAEAENDQLRAANDQLRAENTRLLGLDQQEIAAEIARLRAEVDSGRQQVAVATQALAAVQAETAGIRTHLVQTQEVAMLQEAGIYQYLHPLEDAVAYKSLLVALQDAVKSMVRHDQAVLAATNWTVNGSAREGMAMVRDFSKLMLRAYNAEADNCVRNVKPHRVNAMIDRLAKVRATIARLGKTMSIQISEPYHAARIHEIKLTADYLGKVEEEKERVRAERERQREDERARREFEREKARLVKEQAHYLAAIDKLQLRGATDGMAELQGKLAQIADAIAGVEAREANTRAGYVYVISNIGAFGEGMVKIGMTRRLEPQDRIRELGDASVPFRFDTHALIFSDDAVGLESRLHAELAKQRVNQVNVQREFFYASPSEVRVLLEQIAGQHLLEYHEMPEAIEWRSSGGRQPASALPGG
jgi:hypothetical protein